MDTSQNSPVVTKRRENSDSKQKLQKYWQQPSQKQRDSMMKLLEHDMVWLCEDPVDLCIKQVHKVTNHWTVWNYMMKILFSILQVGKPN